MCDRETRGVTRWRSVFRHCLAPGLATAGVLIAGGDPVFAQTSYGWKFGSKKEASAPALATATPTNGFVVTIHKLQEEAKRKAFDGDIDGAIASAQRARKIADASAALVSEDPDCTVEAADRLVQKLESLKATTTVPTAPSSVMISKWQPPPPTAVAPPRQPATAVVQAPHAPVAQPVAAESTASASRPPTIRRVTPPPRPLIDFSPRPLPAVATLPAAVAGGWEVFEETSEAAENEIALDEIVQSDETTLAFLMARNSAKHGAQENADPGIARLQPAVAEVDEPNRYEPARKSNWYSASAERRVWQSNASRETPDREDGSRPAAHEAPVPTTEPATETAAIDTSFLQPIVAESQRGERRTAVAANSSEDNVDRESNARAAANRGRTDSRVENSNAVVEQATLSLDTSEDQPAVETTAYSTQRGASHAAANDVLEAPISVPSIVFRDVEPLNAADQATEKAATPGLHLAERLAQWMHLPVSMIAAGLAGLGLILLGLGLCMARTAIKPPA